MPPKRKRAADAGPSRPSPHRPDQTNLGQHDRNGGSRGGRNTRRNDRRDPQFAQGAASTANASQPSSPTTLRAPAPPAPQPSPRTASAVAPTTMAPPPVLFPSIPAECYYQIITDARLTAWKQGGRQEIIDHAMQSRSDEDIVELDSIYQEIAHSVHDRRLDPVEAGSIVQAIVSDREKDAPMDGASFDTRYIFLHMMTTLVEQAILPVTEQFKSFLEHTEVSHALMRLMFDSDLLIKLGLVRDTFARVTIRQNTNILYRQQCYNLLREETEGYSKLMTELYNSTTTAGNDPSFEAVGAAFERVKSLIGTFDLDTGRVLDVTLDAFASLVIKQPRFLVKFLRLSSWWPRRSNFGSDDIFIGGLPRWAEPQFACELMNEIPAEDPDAEKRLRRDVAFWDKARTMLIEAFFQLGGREVAESKLLDLADLVEIPQDNAELQWVKATRTMPPPGNKTAAQILGFKLRFYSGNKRSESDILPANMLYLAALLIKIGFISLIDLYPHLHPFDKDMGAVYEKQMKELAEKEKASRPGATTNALMMAGALSDDTVPGTSTRRDVNSTKADAMRTTAEASNNKDASDLPEPLDQKVELLKGLLTIGCLPESLFILGRFPWLTEAYPEELLPLIHRIILHSVSKVFKESRITSKREFECPSMKLVDADQTEVAKGSVKLCELPPRRQLRWPFPDKLDDGNSQAYRYYVDEWIDNIPVCQTVDDIFTLCATFMNVSGVNIGREPELLQSLCSIGINSLRDDPSQSNRDRWQDLLKRLLVPALSLTRANVPCVEAVWKLLQLYPIPVRYNIYAEWYEGTISRLAPIKAAFNRTRLDTLSTMKRLSLTNIPAMARTLAKTSHSSPGIVFKVALDQIESYSNLIQVFVECAKYFTDLGYDVLVWALLSSMGGKQRSRTQKNSVLSISQWLQALSKFSGQVFKRYSNMNPTPVIQYVNHQLLNGNSTDLVILKELIVSMGGLVSNLDFTDDQNAAMTGLTALRKQTLINLQDKRYESTKSAKRLMQALVDAKMAVQLLINIAQYRQNAIYKAKSDAHVKFIATTLDDTHQILIMYLDLLRSNPDSLRFNSLLPSVSQLMTDFGLEPNLAFMIGRFIITNQIDEIAKPKTAAVAAPTETPTEKSPARPPVDADGDIAMINAKAIPAAAEADKMQVDCKDGAAVVSAGSPPAAIAPINQLLDMLQPVTDTIQTTLPSYIWQFITPEFFALFWALELGDLTVPQKCYEEEHKRLHKEAEQIMKDRSDMSRPGMNKKKAKRDLFLDLAKKLGEEMLAHAQRNSKIKLILQRSTGMWLPASQSDQNAICDMILEQCILPRLLLSTNDADYCFRMLKFMHDKPVPNFKLMTFCERLFNSNRLRHLIFSCSVREAEHLGRFIKNLLGELSKWHRNKDGVYEKEALGQTKDGRRALGFAKSIDGEGKPQDFVEHPEFRTLLSNWHTRLYNALSKCLENMEWMHIRNAITVIKTVIDFFPAINFHGTNLLNQLEAITAREAPSKTASDSESSHRFDLSVAAQTTVAQLKRVQRNWVIVQAFRPHANTNDKPADDPKPPIATAPARLNPPASHSHPTSNAKTAPAGEVEDGELKDAKDRPAKSTSQPATAHRATATIPGKPSEPAKDSQKKDMNSKAPATLPQAPNVPQKLSTPMLVPALPVPSTKTEPSKGTTLASVPPSHALPSRPDVPVPGHYSSDRRARDLPPREPQDTREPRERPRSPRDYRERDYRDRDMRDSRDSMRTPDNRRTDPNSRDSGRLPERDWQSRQDGPSRRNDPEHSRSHRDRGTPSDRGHDSRPPLRELSRDVAAPPVAHSAPAKESPASSKTPARAQLIAADKPELINPERAALLAETRAPTADRAPSRNRSPRAAGRGNMDTPTNNRDRDDRHGRGHHPEPRAPRDDRNREAFHPSSRQSGHDARQQDPNYGRLNSAPSTPDIPSGPRGRGGPSGNHRDGSRASNMPNGPSGRPDARFPEAQRTSSPDRQVPTGPSSSRPPPRGPLPAAAPQPSPAAVGVHPDRLRQIDSSMPAPPALPTQPSQNAAPANAPSRPARHSQNARQQQPSQPGPRLSVPPLNTSDQAPASAPTGPHGNRHASGNQPNTPTTDPRSSHAAPTGPSSSAIDRRGARMIKDIQGIVTNNNARRNPPRHISGSDAQVLAGGDPATPIQDRVDPIRRDAGPNRPVSREHGDRGSQASRDNRGANGEEPQPARDTERGSRREHRSNGSGRQSRRSSRERERERDRDRERSPAREREKSHRDYRDRRDGPAPPPGGRDSDRRSGREPASTNPNQEPLGGSSRDPNREPLGPPRDSRHRADGRAEEYGRGNRGPRDSGARDNGARDSGARDSGRPSDDRRDNRDDRSSRKRRSEGGTGGNDREKRARR